LKFAAAVNLMIEHYAALCTRAWVEIAIYPPRAPKLLGRPLHEGVG